MVLESAQVTIDPHNSQAGMRVQELDELLEKMVSNQVSVVL